MLDIGDEVGALVLYTDPALAGAEIEISPAGKPLQRQHVAVHGRHVGTRTLHAAVYYGLAAGTYDLWAGDDSVALTVHVMGGAITEARWPNVMATQ